MGFSFIAPDKSDKRIEFAARYLTDKGYTETEKADFILLGVNPKTDADYTVPCFAGNVSGENIYDYTKDEAFAIENAYLTAEGAIALATKSSDVSLINSKVLIAGYGRIGKALHKYLDVFTKNITVSARNIKALTLASTNGAETVNIYRMGDLGCYDYIFNTVPHPVFNEAELKSIDKNAVLMDLASFPGGVDRHFAEYFGVNLIVARGLPAKISPKSAGIVVAKTVDRMVREVFN